MNVIKTKKPMSLASFLKEASSQGSGIKYVAEKAKLHRMYIPRFQFNYTDENNQPVSEVGPIAEAHYIHEWKSGDKFYSAECTKETYGTCPFCDRVNDAWDIYNERYAKAESELKAQGMDEGQVQWQMRGEQDKEKRKQPNAFKGLYATFIDELKMKDVKPYLYLLVALYEMDPAGNPVCEKGMPKYSLKVWRLPEGRVQMLQDTFASAGGRIEGNEITIQYKNIEDRAQLVGQSTVASVFPDYTWIKQFPGLQQKIEEEAAAFDMESIAKSFEELTKRELAACKNLADAGFAKWDAYKAEKAVNPNAVYLEYAAAPTQNAPALGVGAGAGGGMTFALPGGAAPQMPNMTAPNAGVTPAAPQMGAPMMPPTGAPMMPPTGAPVQQTAPQTPPVQQAAPVQQAPVQNTVPNQGAPIMPPTGGSAPIVPPTGGAAPVQQAAPVADAATNPVAGQAAPTQQAPFQFNI